MSARGKFIFVAVVLGFVWLIGFAKPFDGPAGIVLTCAVGSFTIVKMFHWLKRGNKTSAS